MSAQEITPEDLETLRRDAIRDEALAELSEPCKERAFVDRLRLYTAVKGQAAAYGRIWCHLLPRSNTSVALSDLHRLAEKIGLRRAWFQPLPYPHYDLVPSKRALAVDEGATELDGRQLRDRLLCLRLKKPRARS